MATSLEGSLERRLRDVGLDPADFGDPGQAWQRLYERFGRRATLIDRYALEAASRGVEPGDLDRDTRARLTHELLAVHYPGIEFTPGSGRAISDPIEVVEYSDDWPRAFDGWHARLREALGGSALRIEHIGSTSVPGLAAKPVVDVQVSVAGVADESSYVPAIAGTGVPLRARDDEHRYFRPGGTDPRTVQIHVCAAGSQWERDHLLFRDYLRAHPHARVAYARLKRDMAERYREDRIAYTEAKTGFILDALEDAGAWAERTGWKVEDRPGARP